MMRTGSDAVRWLKSLARRTAAQLRDAVREPSTIDEFRWDEYERRITFLLIEDRFIDLRRITAPELDVRKRP